MIMTFMMLIRTMAMSMSLMKKVITVSYKHPTLPTNKEVDDSGVAVAFKKQ